MKLCKNDNCGKTVKRPKKDTYCLTCLNKRHSKYRQKWARAKKYGMTIAEMETLLNKDKCDICSCILKKKYIDHCHESGEVRGVLCLNCNVALGHFKDNIATLTAAINYLSR